MPSLVKVSFVVKAVPCLVTVSSLVKVVRCTQPIMPNPRPVTPSPGPCAAQHTSPSARPLTPSPRPPGPSHKRILKRRRVSSDGGVRRELKSGDIRGRVVAHREMRPLLRAEVGLRDARASEYAIAKCARAGHQPPRQATQRSHSQPRNPGVAGVQPRVGGAVLEVAAALVAALLAKERGGLNEWDCSVRVIKVRALESILRQGLRCRVCYYRCRKGSAIVLRVLKARALEVLLQACVLLRGLGCSVERCCFGGRCVGPCGALALCFGLLALHFGR